MAYINADTDRYKSNKEDNDLLTLGSSLKPIERVPTEVLRYIFLILHREARKELSEGDAIEPESLEWNMVPDMSKVPWLLGRVCSHWRHIVRAMPTVWFPTRVWLSDSQRTKYSKHTIQHAVTTLPDCAKLIVHYYVLNAVENSMAEVLKPHLHRIDEFSIHSPIEHWESFLSVIPPLSLSRITSLSCFVYPAGGTSHKLETPFGLKQYLFGEDSQLYTLEIDSSIYEFFKTGIPWYRLTNLKLIQSYPVSDETISAYRGHCLFGSISRLTDLTLGLDQNMLQLVLSFDIPWPQLLRLAITVRTRDSVLLVLSKLKRCFSLVEISLCLPSHAEIEHSPIDMPSIKSFSLQGRLSRFFLLSHGIWDTISDLYLGLPSNADNVEELYNVLSRCQHLRRLRIGGVIQPVQKIWSPSGRVVLPHLKTMELRRAYSAWIFDSFVTPSLLSLRIDANGHPSYGLKTVVDFISYSGCQLNLFSLNYHSEGSEDVQLRNLLQKLSTASYVELISFKFNQDILDDISQGVLLPRIETLHIK
ncbi:hypothetical protein C0989_000275 [Termitomyces sp. Mn162]|nr:hypothetical protein C0989_000275 [Termitomyces sp. Mn162]